jgi:hypothetical protein
MWHSPNSRSGQANGPKRVESRGATGFPMDFQTRSSAVQAVRGIIADARAAAWEITSMRRQIVAGALAAAAVLGATAPALAQGQSCFFTTQWRGWKAPDDHTIYINVDNDHRIYRLDLSGSCPALLDPTSSLITDNHTDSICSAIDWNLKVRQAPGFVMPCIVAKMTQLTPAEAAAIPPKYRP